MKAWNVQLSLSRGLDTCADASFILVRTHLQWNGSIVLMRVALAELLQFFPELLNSGGSRRYIFVEFAKRKVEDYGRAIRSGRAPAST